MVLSGDKYNIPHEVKEALPEAKQEATILWAKADPSLPTCRGMWCEALAPMLMLPCFWPHALCLCFPFAMCALARKNTVLSQNIVITDSSIEYINLPHDTCCIPGCYVKSLVVRSVPINIVESVIIDYKDSGCLACCYPDFPKLRILDGTMSSGSRRHAAQHVGTLLYGYSNVQEIRDTILAVKEGRGGDHFNEPVYAPAHAEYAKGSPSAPPVEITQVQIEEGSNGVKKRLEDLKQLLDTGLITPEDYEKTKSNILSSM